MAPNGDKAERIIADYHRAAATLLANEEAFSTFSSSFKNDLTAMRAYLDILPTLIDRMVGFPEISAQSDAVEELVHGPVYRACSKILTVNEAYIKREEKQVASAKLPFPHEGFAVRVDALPQNERSVNIMATLATRYKFATMDVAKQHNKAAVSFYQHSETLPVSYAAYQPVAVEFNAAFSKLSSTRDKIALIRKTFPSLQKYERRPQPLPDKPAKKLPRPKASGPKV